MCGFFSGEDLGINKSKEIMGWNFLEVWFVEICRLVIVVRLESLLER